MIKIANKILDYWNKNKVYIKNVNLNKDLELFLLIDSDDANFAELILDKILDSSIDKISINNTYKDFAISLENVNTILKTWEQDDREKIERLNIIIWILNKNNLYFSNIWKTSAYLVKNTNEVMEITEKEEQKKVFLYISEGKLDNYDTIIMWTDRLLNYLSYSDFSDSALWKKVEDLNRSIEIILEDEKMKNNLWILSFKYCFFTESSQENSKIKDSLHKIFYRVLDNSITKRIIAIYMITKEKIKEQSKIIKNVIYITGILVSLTILYFIISGIASTSINTQTLEDNKEDLVKAKEYIKIASDNWNNPDIFELNIQNAENLINTLKGKWLFANDLGKLSEDLAIVKKQFYWVETFIEKPENLVYSIDKTQEAIKVLKISKKLYIITKNSIIWPIIPTQQAKLNTFSELKNDSFIDATPFWTDIILLTKAGKVVEFTKNWLFSFKDVKDQKTWESSNTILSFWQNIYLVSKDENQIYKHKESGNSFSSWEWYLKKEDSETIWKIIDIAIDWGIYLLKDDLSIVKFFSSPYRIENIVINKLAKNYNIENKNSIVKIKASANLNYVYILLNNTIWILEPSTKRFQDTKSLTYIWQIEWSQEKIIDFHINNDWQIDLLNKNWIYSLNFEINDGKIIVR